MGYAIILYSVYENMTNSSVIGVVPWEFLLGSIDGKTMDYKAKPNFLLNLMLEIPILFSHRVIGTTYWLC